MRAIRRTPILGSLLLAWFIVAVALYIWVSRDDFLHIISLPLQPFLPALAGDMATVEYALALVSALLGAAIFSAACASLGLAILGDWEKLQADHLAIGATAFLTGEIVLSIVFLTCIVLYKLTPQIVAISLALSLLIGLRSLARLITTWPRWGLRAALSRSDKFILALILAVMVLGVLYSSSRLSVEAGSENFAQAKLMAISQTAVYSYPEDPFLVSSFHPGILFTALIQLFGDQSARLMSWVNGLVILLIGLAIGAEAGLTPKARLWFLALMVSSTAFVDLLGDGKVELISTAPMLAGVYWMLRSVKVPTESTFALMGLLIGFAMVARPYNIFLAPLFVVAFYTIHIFERNREGTFNFRKFVWTAAWMLPSLWAIGAFHLLQNWLWLGNPIAPLVEGRHLSATAWQWQFDPKLLAAYRLLYPLAVSFVNSPQSLGNITPFFAGILPFLLMKRVSKGLRERPPLLWLALSAALTLVLWVAIFFTVVEIRYVFFIWVLLFLVVAQVMDHALALMDRPIRDVMNVVVLALLAYMGLRTVMVAGGTYSPIDAGGQAHCFNTEYCKFLDPLNRQAALGERVFVLNSYRYYLRNDLFACASRAHEYAGMESLAKEDSPEFWVELYRQGFQYVTYDTNFAVFHTQFGPLPSPREAPAWLQVTELSSGADGQEKVYRLEAMQPPMQTQAYCEQDNSGIWQVRQGTPPGRD